MSITRPSSGRRWAWSSTLATGPARAPFHQRPSRRAWRRPTQASNPARTTLQYELVPDWEQLPTGWEHGDVAGVATDSQDRVYVFNRSEHPVIVYDRDGRFLGSWGEGVFTRPHGITITLDDTVYCADDTDHTVRVFTTEGKLMQTLGTANQPSDTGYREGSDLRQIKRGAGPFNRPTRLSRAPGGDLYVADGYGNARVHHFAPSGELVESW